MQNLEQDELDLLREEGHVFTTKHNGKEKTFRTKPMTLKRLLDLSDLYIKMKVDEDLINKGDMADFIAENYRSVNQNAKKAAKSIAISVSDNLVKRFFLSRYFMKAITPTELKEISDAIFKQSDYKNFMISIALMNGGRITKPTPIEKTTA